MRRRMRRKRRSTRRTAERGIVLASAAGAGRLERGAS